MATQAERINAMEANMAAILAALQGGAAPTEAVETEDDVKPTKAKTGNAAKANVVKVPTVTVTDDDGVRFRFTQAYQSTPKNSEPVKYRTPRVLMELKSPTDDDFHKIGTLLPSVLAAIQAIPEAKIVALSTDAREA